MITDHLPTVLVRNEEPDNRPAARLQRVFVVGLNDLAGCRLVAKFLDLSSELIIEHIRQPFEKYQRENEVLELGCIRGPSDCTCPVPQPRLQSRNIKMAAIQSAHRRHPYPFSFPIL